MFSKLGEEIYCHPELMPNWRFDPWLFEAFKLAVGKLLDRFQPTGKTMLPDFWRFIRDKIPDIEGPLSRTKRASHGEQSPLKR